MIHPTKRKLRRWLFTANIVENCATAVCASLGVPSPDFASIEQDLADLARLAAELRDAIRVQRRKNSK